MRQVVLHPSAPDLGLTEERKLRLQSWFQMELEDALAARHAQEAVWRECLRDYEGIPKNPVRNVPVENAPNIVITLGAIACDAIYAMAMDLIYSANPVLTCQAVGKGSNDASKEAVKDANAMQLWVNWGAKNEWNLRDALNHTLLDDVQLGTGVFYIPWVEVRKKTRTHAITAAHPVIRSKPVEDLLVPGGAYADPEQMRWVATRDWYTRAELEEVAQARDWDISQCVAMGIMDWTRSQRERLGRTTKGSHQLSELYEVWTVWGYYDIDQDKLNEDLQWVYDRGSNRLLDVGFTGYDHRPIEAMVYQARAHLFYGLGVMDMVRPYQNEVTEVHNYRNLNMLLANSRFWIGAPNAVPEGTKIWPGKVQDVVGGPDALKPHQMADVYPSIHQAETMTLMLAERRVGVNELSASRPSAVMGSRTPGITAMTMMQQHNRRFTPAFESLRTAATRSIVQCLYRYQERLLAGDAAVEQHIKDVLGAEDGDRVIRVLKDASFDEAIRIETTATSVTVNKEADKQNALLLVNVLGGYYQKTLELIGIASNPQTPPPVRDVARKIAEAAGAIIERTIRTFDQIRDPATFIIDTNAEIDQTQGMEQSGVMGLMQIMQAMQGQEGAGGQNGLVPMLPGTAQ